MSQTTPIEVVITRPQAQAEPWAAQLAELGIASSQCPLLAIRPVTDEAQQRQIKNKVLDFDLYQKAIFVSQNAVHYGLHWLDQYWPQLPVGVEYFAVGASTAKALAQYDLQVSDLAASSSGAMTSESLLLAPQLQSVEGQKIVIFRGLGGRGHLAEELRKRGAQVDYCELYERIIPAQAQAQFSALLTRARQQPDQLLVIALHSGESFQNLAHLIAQLPEPEQADARGLVQAMSLLLPSERLAQQAREAGFGNIILASNATDDAMSAALLNYCARHS